MSLSILLGQSEPWLLGAGACVVILLIVSILILRRGGKRKQTKSKEEEKTLTVTPVEPQGEVQAAEKEDTSTESENEAEPLTTYCNNGCQGACACPSLEPQREESEPTLSPHASLSPPDVPLPEPLREVSQEVRKPDSQSSLRKRSLDKGRFTFQHLKEKLHSNRESFDATGSDRRGSELDGSGKTGSEERRTSLFSGWRKLSLAIGSKRRSSEQVGDDSSQHKTESLKLLRGIFSFKKSTSIEGVKDGPAVDPPLA